MKSTDTLERLPTVIDRAFTRPTERPLDETPKDREQEFVTLVPVDDEHFEETDAGVCGLIELILKDRSRLHRLIRARKIQPLLVGRLLAISLTSFVLFGLVMSLVLTVSGRWPVLTPVSDWLQRPLRPLAYFEANAPGTDAAAPWTSGNAFKLTLSYAAGLVAASGVCLPSLYFYCLLAGVRLKMVDVVLHTVKAKAEAALALMGILPIYVALAMGVVIFGGSGDTLTAVLLLGLILPFIAGLWGTASLYQGFSQLCTTMPASFAARRECFLRRLVLSWSACYSAVVPVMIYTLWEVSSRL